MIPSVMFQRQPLVQVKPAWAGEWISRPDIYCTSATSGLSPVRWQAEFVQYYGKVIEPGEPQYITRQPARQLHNWFVRLAYPAADTDVGGDGFVTLWQGIIVAITDMPGGHTGGRASGQLTLTAAGMDYLLSNTSISGSWCKLAPASDEGEGDEGDEGEGDEGDDTPVSEMVFVDTVMPFNFAISGGLVRGNRSTEKINGSYVFADDGELWTAFDVLEYLIIRFGPLDPYISLGYINPATQSALQTMNGTWRPASTIAATLNILFNRRRGISWLVTSTVTGEAYLDVCSLFDTPVAAGDFYFPAASSKVNIDADAMNQADKLTITKSVVQTVDEIRVVGEQLWVCGEIPLKPAWSPQRESEYIAAEISEQTGDKFAGVYTTYGIDAEGGLPFCRHAADLTSAGSSRMSDTITERLGCPAIDDSGQVKFDVNSPMTLVGKTLTRSMPLGASLDYGTDEAPDISEASELLLARAFIYDFDGKTHSILPTDALSRFRMDATNVGLSVRHDGLGIELHPPFRHYIGSSQAQSPLLNSGLYATAALRADERLKVVRKIASADRPRQLVIYIPGAQCWVARRGTIWSGTDNYSFKRLENDLVIRNDADQLTAAAALAENWYTKPRRSVSLTRKYLQADLVAGDMISTVTIDGEAIEVNTVVTARVWDFTTMTTRIETSYDDIDFAGIVARRPAYLQSSWQSPLSPPERPQNNQVRTPAADAYILAIITGHTVAGSSENCQWKYSWAEAVVTEDAAGKHAAESKPNGQTGTDNARNLAELINPDAATSTAPYGNGVYPAQLTNGTFAVEPVATGTVVILRQSGVQKANGENWTTQSQYLFSYATNPVSGECD